MIGPLYASCLDSGLPLDAVYPDGRRVPVPVDDWRRPLLPGDESMLARCAGPTLDVGCGPGRLSVALRRRGLPALGLDVSPTAVRLARRAGAVAHHGSVFNHVPATGRWSTTLLADGNIGIGGAPVVLLRRLRDLMSRSGRALVEVDSPSVRSCLVNLRLASGDDVCHPFPWARLSVQDAGAVAGLAGLRAEETWEVEGRWFVALRRS